MMTAIFVVALVQTAAINGQRDTFIACLEAAGKGATAQKMAAEAIEPYMRSTCASSESSFKSSLVAFDVKNKVGRKQATADAQVQADDFITSSVDQYKAVLARK